MEYYQKRIRDLREDADKTQSEIAEVLGTSQTMYAMSGEPVSCPSVTSSNWPGITMSPRMIFLA